MAVKKKVGEKNGKKCGKTWVKKSGGKKKFGSKKVGVEKIGGKKKWR